MALPPVLAPEDQVTGPGHVGGGEEGAHQPDHHHGVVAVLGRPHDDLVLGPEAGEGEDAGQRDGTHDEGPEGGGHVLPQPTHVAHVVRVHGVDERAGPEEEEGLEEGVGEEVEDPCRPGAHPHGHHHVADLADGGVREHSLDVVLHEGEETPDDHGDGADGGHLVDPVAVGPDREALDEHAVHAGDEVDAGHHHGGGVDQGRHRRGAGHGVGQPHVERELGALSHHPQEQQRRPEQQQAVADVAVEGQPVEVGDVEVLAGGEEQEDDPESQAHVADARGDEGLDGGVGVDLLLPPVPDEHERAQADELPPDQQLEGVVGHHQVQHRGREQ